MSHANKNEQFYYFLLEKDIDEKDRKGKWLQKLIETIGFMNVYAIAANAPTKELFDFAHKHKLFDLKAQRVNQREKYKKEQKVKVNTLAEGKTLENVPSEMLALLLQGDFYENELLKLEGTDFWDIQPDVYYRKQSRISRHEDGQLIVQSFEPVHSENLEIDIFDDVHAYPCVVNITENESGVIVEYLSGLPNVEWWRLDLQESTKDHLVWDVTKPNDVENERVIWTRYRKDYLPREPVDEQTANMLWNRPKQNLKWTNWYLFFMSSVKPSEALYEIQVFCESHKEELGKKLAYNKVTGEYAQGVVLKTAIEYNIPRLLKYLLEVYKNHFRLPHRLPFATATDYVQNMAFQKMSILHYAVAYNHPEIVEILLQYGADPNKFETPTQRFPGVTRRQPPSRTPFHTACRIGNMKIIRSLLDHGANVKSVDIDGKQQRQPLKDAIEGRHSEVVKLLIDKGLDKASVLDLQRAKKLNVLSSKSTSQAHKPA